MEMAVLSKTNIWPGKEDVLPGKNTSGYEIPKITKDNVIVPNRERKIEELFNTLRPLGFKMLAEDENGVEAEIA